MRACCRKKLYEFSFYGGQLEQEGAAVAVAQVAPSQIKGGNLARILQLAMEENAESGIYVSVRVPLENI